MDLLLPLSFIYSPSFFSGIIIGIIGLAIHIYELIFQGITDLEGLETIFFFINLILPFPLVFFCCKAYKKNKRIGNKI